MRLALKPFNIQHLADDWNANRTYLQLSAERRQRGGGGPHKVEVAARLSAEGEGGDVATEAGSRAAASASREKKPRAYPPHTPPARYVSSSCVAPPPSHSRLRVAAPRMLSPLPPFSRYASRAS
ncbi:hypothetical protein EMIHUDRAFT_195312 [Emiliania huxleyi CCMP1516]|uniref:Uncharacterized protein n=2 Tax=Emiliania huxleyi TaxID=2903 RepID=A0A0D3JHA4_EMIH1|nr:hypothetical protein EMIHUDRAFT_195312 [Emiliania huxleyi CCMP1516]EOD22889.1 hypothetical protein EMIHUDRAFT_195312 [Emiliania huxleyi CCMP1516]|eukprot:XP_005775318.1 hypothetical protein EMIHUDRAFT_195312 [Emiliania huxleyi CCMP1516]